MVKFNLQLFAKKSVTDIANEVIQGKWGNGATRKNKLTSAGYNYDEVQSTVNSILGGSSTKTTTNKTTQNKTSSSKNTTKNKTTTSTIKGVSAEDSTFKASKDLTNANKKQTSAMTEAEEYIKNDPISQETLDRVGAQFELPEWYINTMNSLDGTLAQILSGRTSHSDDVERMKSEIENREKFEYDVDNDQLFQQALASAMNSGKTAMQDTIGQASALTGGYGSTYATSAGNQAYNAFIEDAYNNLPEYYNMALQAYQMEGEEMYKQLGMYMDMDNTEYSRLVSGFTTGLDFANKKLNTELDVFATNTTNAYNAANLSLSEYNAVSSNLIGLANMYGDYATTKYEQEYKDWYDKISFLNSDYWAGENLNISQQELGLKKNEYKVSTGDTNMDGVLSADEKAAMNTTYTYDSSGKPVKVDNTSADVDNIPKAVNTRASKLKTDEELSSYLDNQVDAGIITESQADYLYNVYKTPSTDEPTQKVNVAKVSDNFRTVKGDNFTVTYGKNTYKLENEGKVEDADLVKKLNGVSTSNGDVFLYDGETYLKYANGYYKIGAQDGFMGWFPDADYQDLIKALQK